MPVTPLAQQCRSIIIMGVAGSGKSTIASLLSDMLGYVYLEGDDFHSAEAKAMMAAGIPLTDALRESWIDRLCQQLSLCQQQQKSCVLSYSGLIARQRQRIRTAGSPAQFFYLYGDESLLLQRLKARQNHFMPATMLRSQLDTMQSPEHETDVHYIDIADSTAQILAQICRHLSEC